MRKGKMTIQEATREWFEMELPEGTKPSRYQMTEIDANYFFDKVVGMMGELGLRPETNYYPSKTWTFFWLDSNMVRMCKIFSDKDIVLAGLQAAIAARKEIGDV